MPKFTVFCQDSDGTGTMYIDSVEADNLDAAMAEGARLCRQAWGYPDDNPDAVRVVGVAAGYVDILHWDDEP